MSIKGGTMDFLKKKISKIIFYIVIVMSLFLAALSNLNTVSEFLYFNF